MTEKMPFIPLQQIDRAPVGRSSGRLCRRATRYSKNLKAKRERFVFEHIRTIEIILQPAGQAQAPAQAQGAPQGQGHSHTQGLSLCLTAPPKARSPPHIFELHHSLRVRACCYSTYSLPHTHLDGFFFTIFNAPHSHACARTYEYLRMGNCTPASHCTMPTLAKAEAWGDHAASASCRSNFNAFRSAACLPSSSSPSSLARFAPLISSARLELPSPAPPAPLAPSDVGCCRRACVIISIVASSMVDCISIWMIWSRPDAPRRRPRASACSSLSSRRMGSVLTRC